MCTPCCKNIYGKMIINSGQRIYFKKPFQFRNCSAFPCQYIVLKEVPWDFGICGHPTIKDVLCEDPVATTFFFLARMKRDLSI